METQRTLIYKGYASTYQSIKYSDSGKGLAVQDQYLAINSSGYYDGAIPVFPVNRPEGRYDFFLAYSYSGRSYIQRGDETHTANSGDILFFCPGDPQYYWYDKTDYIKNYWIHFTGYGAESLFSQIGIASGVPHHIGFVVEIGELIERIIAEINSLRVGGRLYAEGLLIQLLAIVARKCAENLPLNIKVRNERIYRVVEYIKENFDQDLSVKDLAAMSYLSINRFTNVFRESVGVAPQRYIIEFRLHKAIELMKLTDWDIRQIAEAVGYTDQTYFSRVFKKYTQLTPSQFLAKLRGIR